MGTFHNQKVLNLNTQCMSKVASKLQTTYTYLFSKVKYRLKHFGNVKADAVESAGRIILTTKENSGTKHNIPTDA